MAKYLALGDCNTLGIEDCVNNAYPERLAALLDMSLINTGYTMSTVREGQHFFDHYFSQNNPNHDRIELVTIQFGLVDSWVTFKYAPYVLYYPDNALRRGARKLVKKYKKICRKSGLNDRFGVKNVVSIDVYEMILRNIIQRAPKVFLIDTVPNKAYERNAAIQQYNAILSKLAESYDHVFKVDLYDYFADNMESLYIDNTHVNADGHDYISRKLKITYENSHYPL